MYNVAKFISGYTNICNAMQNENPSSENAMEMMVREIIHLSRLISRHAVSTFYRKCLDVLNAMMVTVREDEDGTISDIYEYISKDVCNFIGAPSIPYIFACIEISGVVINYPRIFLNKRNEFSCFYIDAEWWKESEAIIQYVIERGDDVYDNIDILKQGGKQPAIEKIPSNNECLISYEQITNSYVECTGPIPHCYDIDEYSKYATINQNAHVCPYDKTYEMNVQCFVVPNITK